MTKEIVKRVSISEKIADFMMDIAKYILTAIIITSAFEELADYNLMMYISGLVVAATFFSVSLILLNQKKI
mgnify:CR=1 FL=1|jgi:hypothetical protein